MSLLPDFAWHQKYDADGRSLVETFFIPALASATRYDRTTGYFSAGVLMLASRGIEGLVRANGRMRLVVGCTLGPDEVAAIERGQQLRSLVSARLGAAPLQPSDDEERQSLELLSWMVARGHLEMKVAIPCDAHRRPVASTVLFHEKAGIWLLRPLLMLSTTVASEPPDSHTLSVRLGAPRAGLPLPSAP